MLDVIVVGAGPAGSTAALRLARAGARVLIVDREAFPRDKLCGDTLNPGAVRLLTALHLAPGPLQQALPLAGMRVTGPTASVSARYGPGIAALAIRRLLLDEWLLGEAIRAGARFESGLTAERPLMDASQPVPVVRGVVLRHASRGVRRELRVPASVTIAADGRRSTLGRALRLVRTPPSPRRWAFGTYATDVRGMTDLGEMHVRAGYYIGLAPVPGSLVNVCVVTRRDGAAPLEIIRRAIAQDRDLQARFADAQLLPDVRVLGPLAADASAPGVPGLVLAGDAAGFIDPMTGDGLHLAFEGARLAAEEVARTLSAGDFTTTIGRLATARRRVLGRKMRFNRVLRRLVDSPTLMRAASLSAHLAPALIERTIRAAGDVS